MVNRNHILRGTIVLGMLLVSTPAGFGQQMTTLTVRPQIAPPSSSPNAPRPIIVRPVSTAYEASAATSMAGPRMQPQMPTAVSDNWPNQSIMVGAPEANSTQATTSLSQQAPQNTLQVMSVPVSAFQGGLASYPQSTNTSVMEQPSTGGTVDAAPADYANNPMPMTGPGCSGTNCGYSRCNLPPQPEGIPSGCYECIQGVDCASSPYPQKWCDSRPISFAPLYHGQYQGPIRLPAVQQYRVRIGDRLKFIFVFAREQLSDSYRLMAGDEILISAVNDTTINQGDLSRGIPILSDGMIYLKYVGPVRAEGLTIVQLRRNLEAEYSRFVQVPGIDVQPVKFNTSLEDLRSAVDGRFGAGGQNVTDTVHADGTISLPKLGPVCVLGLTLQEIKRELNLRYREMVVGLTVEPQIDTEAPHFVYVYGEVNKPDRYQLNGPTLVSQALAMAGSVKQGGNLRQIVIFRRAEDWRLLATRIDIRGELFGKTATPADDIWLCDNDVIIVAPTPVRQFNYFVQQVFTQGIYGIVPFQGFSITQFQSGSVSAN